MASREQDPSHTVKAIEPGNGDSVAAAAAKAIADTYSPANIKASLERQYNLLTGAKGPRFGGGTNK